MATLDLTHQLKIVLMQLRQAPGGELSPAALVALDGVTPALSDTKLDLPRLLKLAEHLKQTGFSVPTSLTPTFTPSLTLDPTQKVISTPSPTLDLALALALPNQSERDLKRLEWWADDYKAWVAKGAEGNSSSATSALKKDVDEESGPGPVEAANASFELDEADNSKDVSASSNPSFELESSATSQAQVSSYPAAATSATSKSKTSPAPNELDHAINKIYHRQKLVMLTPLALKLRQVKGGEIKLKTLEEGYIRLLREFNQQLESLKLSQVADLMPLVGLTQRDLVRLLWLTAQFKQLNPDSQTQKLPN